MTPPMGGGGSGTELVCTKNITFLNVCLSVFDDTKGFHNEARCLMT